MRLSGNTLSVFAGGVQLGSDTDVTGSVFDNINRIGRVGSNSLNGETATLNVFDRALTQTEIDYYSYLRSETGEILLPPLLPSTPTIYNINSATLNGTSQYYDAGNPSEFAIFNGNTPYSVEYWYFSPKTLTGAGINIAQQRFTDTTFVIYRNNKMI